MSSWLAVSLAVPVGIGLGTSFSVLQPRAAGWYHRLRKPTNNVPFQALFPGFALLYTLCGISAYLAINEAMLAQNTQALKAVRAGQLGMGSFWLGLTFAVFWPRMLAWGPSLKLALANGVVAGMWFLVAAVQFFRLTVAGGMLMLACVAMLGGLGWWNASLIQMQAAPLSL
ncbi:hypothetical protein EV183_005237 [Coemansia sp. RSA 2336]|nr:hypothetical protein EV183_005237 [Coemansia sp. RSA 2336]